MIKGTNIVDVNSYALHEFVVSIDYILLVMLCSV